MRYQFEGPPYEHTCPKCGRHQKVTKYDTDPSFGAGVVNEFTEDGVPGIEAEMVVELNKQFKCIACGYVKYFDDATIDTGVTTKMVVDTQDGKLIEINKAVRKLKRKFRKEHDIEEYL